MTKAKKIPPYDPGALRITVTKTSDGARDYVQIMSADTISVNIVLVASLITVSDYRNSKA